MEMRRVADSTSLLGGCAGPARFSSVAGGEEYQARTELQHIAALDPNQECSPSLMAHKDYGTHKGHPQEA
jgi:hypothetical protein